ncbi:hypothetical protein N658DRAFT_198427 [Parathielavia hyrcaniae]|uniref:Uncharacterized protein n=1 Tax=Parathielavia hyrcaniae TaxID=113614 RepID=A0AAN6T5S2_9PEZI|nr:hypothetical protein N658DRAFT_198427 [Parathielavia hyrcaniae]
MGAPFGKVGKKKNLLDTIIQRGHIGIPELQMRGERISTASWGSFMATSRAKKRRGSPGPSGWQVYECIMTRAKGRVYDGVGLKGVWHPRAASVSQSPGRAGGRWGRALQASFPWCEVQRLWRGWRCSEPGLGMFRFLCLRFVCMCIRLCCTSGLSGYKRGIHKQS